MRTKKVAVVLFELLVMLTLASCTSNQPAIGESLTDTDGSQVETDASQSEGTVSIEIGDGDENGFSFTNQLYNTVKGLYYEENVNYESSVVSDTLCSLGSFPDRASFDVALNEYVAELTPLFEESGQFADIQPFVFNLTDSTGGGLYALSKDMSFSVSVNCETDGYQSVDYSVSFFPHSSDNKVTPKTVCQDVLSYTGVVLSTQDIERVRGILNEAETDTVYVEGTDGHTTIVFSALSLNTEKEYWSISVTRTI